MKVKIYKVLSRTAGGFHSWCLSSAGRIRKPNNAIDISLEPEVEIIREPVMGQVIKIEEVKVNLWVKLVNWFKRLLR